MNGEKKNMPIAIRPASVPLKRPDNTSFNAPDLNNRGAGSPGNRKNSYFFSEKCETYRLGKKE
jgi:hypothetical protein